MHASYLGLSGAASGKTRKRSNYYYVLLLLLHSIPKVSCSIQDTDEILFSFSAPAVAVTWVALTICTCFYFEKEFKRRINGSIYTYRCCSRYMTRVSMHGQVMGFYSTNLCSLRAWTWQRIP